MEKLLKNAKNYISVDFIEKNYKKLSKEMLKDIIIEYHFALYNIVIMGLDKAERSFIINLDNRLSKY